MDIFNGGPSLLWAILLRLAAAIITLFVGRWLASWSRRWLDMRLRQVDLTESMVTFATTSIYGGIWLFTILSVLALMGVPVTSIVAVSGMALIVIGVALRESLSDLAATVIFVLFKPFVVGDLIQTKGVMGIVREIELFNTVILAEDNQVHIFANSQIQSNGVTNYSKMGTLRVELRVGISYGDDMSLARRIVEDELHGDTRVLDEPPMEVFVEELGNSGVTVSAFPFVKSEDYLKFQRGILEPIKLRLEDAGITIPFPQRDVHIYNTGDNESE